MTMQWQGGVMFNKYTYILLESSHSGQYSRRYITVERLVKLGVQQDPDSLQVHKHSILSNCGELEDRAGKNRLLAAW